MNSGNEKVLTQYLIAHECDIADGTNDFGDLRSVFIEMLNRKPEETPVAQHRSYEKKK